ncbi:MAG TPA: PAS domain-containing methyl-accepting chemotaxis protein [Alphaproteobacteria bacterium]|nr:PAS domain-containing methyl-accepting chemotaxis protein [Alphaproteobacteria bacterium]
MFAIAASQNNEQKAKLEAIDKSQAVIEFLLDGTILNANQNFLDTMNYTLEEIRGKHHSMFVPSDIRSSMEYKQFWDSLNRGEYHSDDFKRVGKGGREVWIHGSYNPVFDRSGKPCKVIKYAVDITDQKLKAADYEGQIAAINKSQAVIEFNMDGTILNANENFLNAVGYRLDEIKGKHHSMFVDAEYRGSVAYQQFWAALNRGEYQTGEYKRFGKGGREIWIQASYNPILGLDGKPCKVVKFASDTTKQVQTRLNNERASRVITENIGEISQAISQASQQSSETATASGQTSANVQAIAAGAEELNASVKEITHSMDKSRALADEAVNNVKTADEATQKLTNAAQSMSGIVELIQNIASQINLLALNATIESARAGEAGKGFAVVANEVKNLANQAKGATDQISQEIDGVQKVSVNVADALTAIKKSIDSVREYVTTTAGAVDQQSSVAREMSSNMQSMATAVTAISHNATEIAKATDHANTATLKVKDAVAVLAG